MEPRQRPTKASRSSGRTKRSAVSSMDSGGAIHAGPTSSRKASSSAAKRWSASQSASPKWATICSRSASRSEPISR